MNRTRHDRGWLSSPKPTAHGSVLYNGIAATVHDTGNPLVYSPSDSPAFEGKEYRGLDEVKSIARQLPTMPVKIDHGGNPIGRVISARVDGAHVVATFEIDRPPSEAAALLRSRPEISLGYQVGHIDGNGFQHDIRVSELSIVERARCGATCATKLDCSRADGLDDEAEAMAAMKLRTAGAWAAPRVDFLPTHEDVDPDDDSECDCPESEDPDSECECDDGDPDSYDPMTVDSADTEESAALALRRRTASAWTRVSGSSKKSK